jgi:Flp pilus assembly protein TadD
MKRTAAVLAAVIVIAACRGDDGLRDDQSTGSIDSAAWRQARDLPPDVLAALDSGNAAFRAKDFNVAREQYLRAIELAPGESSGWFGLSMVERQLGNIAAADSAMMRVRELTPEASLVAPGPDTTRIHP